MQFSVATPTSNDVEVSAKNLDRRFQDKKMACRFTPRRTTRAFQQGRVTRERKTGCSADQNRTRNPPTTRFGGCTTRSSSYTEAGSFGSRNRFRTPRSTSHFVLPRPKGR